MAASSLHGGRERFALIASDTSNAHITVQEMAFDGDTFDIGSLRPSGHSTLIRLLRASPQGDYAILGNVRELANGVS